jgi:hypothetical protein
MPPQLVNKQQKKHHYEENHANCGSGNVTAAIGTCHGGQNRETMVV